MKLFFSLIFPLLAWAGVSAQEVTEYFSVGNPIRYCDTEYYLAWSASPHKNYYVQEYLPKGEAFENYSKMFTVNVLFTDLTPQQAIQMKIEELDKRKKTDPVVNYMSAEKEGNYILEFIVSDTHGDKINCVETDVHCYRQITIGGRKAILLLFYSCRGYGDDIKPFIMSIPDKRVDWYEGMAALKVNPVFQKGYGPRK